MKNVSSAKSAEAKAVVLSNVANKKNRNSPSNCAAIPSNRERRNERTGFGQS